MKLNPKTYHYDVVLTPYSGDTDMTSTVYQTKSNRDGWLDGETVKLYTGWGKQKENNAVIEVTGDPASQVWGRLPVESGMGCYTAEVSVPGYQTIMLELVIDTQTDEILVPIK